MQRRKNLVARPAMYSALSKSFSTHSACSHSSSVKPVPYWQ
jgi:hypothetical protein